MNMRKGFCLDDIKVFHNIEFNRFVLLSLLIFHYCSSKCKCKSVVVGSCNLVGLEGAAPVRQSLVQFLSHD